VAENKLIALTDRVGGYEPQDGESPLHDGSSELLERDGLFADPAIHHIRQ